MQTMHKVVGVLAAVAGFSVVNVARATDMYFCNNTPNTIWVAQGLLGDGIFGATGYPGMQCNNFQQDGIDDIEWVDWYRADPGTCTHPFSGCMTSDNYLWYVEDSVGHYWAGAGMNGQYNPISTSQHVSDCCNEYWENPNSLFSNLGPGIDQCRAGAYPDWQQSIGPRWTGGLRGGFLQVCATSQTYNIHL